MTRKEFANRLKGELGMTALDAERAVCTMFACLTTVLAEGQELSIRGFGAFHLKERKGKAVRNFHAGSSMHSEDTTLPALYAYPELMRRVQGVHIKKIRKHRTNAPPASQWKGGKKSERWALA